LFFNTPFISPSQYMAKSTYLKRKCYSFKTCKNSIRQSINKSTKILSGIVSIIVQDTLQKPLNAARVTIFSQRDSIVSSLTDSLGQFSIDITNIIKDISNPFYISVRHSANYKSITKIYKNFKNPIILNAYKFKPSKVIKIER
jgi:hypothetical protein